MSAASVQIYDPLRDKTYRATSLGRDVAAFLDWKELGGASPRTLDQYERDLARGALMFPDRTAATLTDQEAIHIAKQFHAKERRVRVAAWNSFYRWAKQMRLTDRNPFDVLPQIKRTPQKVHDVFTDAEVAALEGLGGVDGPLFAIMFGTGARKGDCRRLRVKHFRPAEFVDERAAVDHDEMPPELLAAAEELGVSLVWNHHRESAPQRDQLVFLAGKGGKDRLVPIPRKVSTAIAELITFEGLGDNDHFWYSVRANEISRKVMRRDPVGEGTFARWYTDCLERAGVRYRNPHTTRHTFATSWLRNGGRLETLSMILGHASIRTTFDEYAHLDTRDVLADLAVIEGRA